MADEIDSIVKGSPRAGFEPKIISSSGSGGPDTTPIIITYGPGKPGDPLRHTPSSPSMIYLNLLVLEASLRAQYLELRARRRHHTFFLLLLSAWILGFGYALFLAPREDGRGVGGSVYWGVEMLEKLGFLGGVVTAILVWGTGIFERGVRWPRRWFSISNRGLRGFNCKLVLVSRPWWAELASTLGFFLTYGLFSHTASSSYRFVDTTLLREVDRELQLLSDVHPSLPPSSAAAAAVAAASSSSSSIATASTSAVSDDEGLGHEEDLAPGGDYVKLLLLAKLFSADFRENWELYRTEYWERENERRALLRRKLEARDRDYARQRWGLLWWLPWHRAATLRQFSKENQLRLHQQQQQAHSHREHRLRSTSHHSLRRGSNSSSRSQTPTLDDEYVPSGRKISGAATLAPSPIALGSEGNTSNSNGGSGGGVSGSEKRRKKASSGTKRATTPEVPSPLAREGSVASEGGRMKTKPRKRSPSLKP